MYLASSNKVKILAAGLKGLRAIQGVKEKTDDIFVVIGTSLNVYPAAGLLNYLPPRVPIYVIDPNELPIKGSDYHFIQNGASKGMDELMKILLDKN